jgi:hypothetical protein
MQGGGNGNRLSPDEAERLMALFDAELMFHLEDV